MTAALAFLVACALVGLYSRAGGTKAYVFAVAGACLLAAAYYSFSGLM